MSRAFINELLCIDVLLLHFHRLCFVLFIFSMPILKNLNKWQRCFARRLRLPFLVNHKLGFPKRQLGSVKGSWVTLGLGFSCLGLQHEKCDQQCCTQFLVCLCVFNLLHDCCRDGDQQCHCQVKMIIISFQINCYSTLMFRNFIYIKSFIEGFRMCWLIIFFSTLCFRHHIICSNTVPQHFHFLST